jgi:NAD dependent epimerase/dehydratase family enzyme
MAEVLLGGQRTVPSRLTAAGFEFRYPQIEGALSDLVSHPKD